MQEIFNKVDQNQLQRTKNVVYFLDATETLSISAGSISSRAEMTCGTPHIAKPVKPVDDRVIHAQGAVANSLLLPHNRERHNGFLANSRDTSIKPEMSSE